MAMFKSLGDLHRSKDSCLEHRYLGSVGFADHYP